MKIKRLRLWILLFILGLSLSLYIYILLKDDEREPYIVDIYLINKAFSATAELLILDEEGNMMSCTAFAYQKNENKYRFAFAGHCATKQIYDDDYAMNIVGENVYLLILRSVLSGKKSVYFARLVAVDINSKIGDFAVIEAEIDTPIQLLALSKRPAASGECIFNISFPKVAWGNVFYGYVATNKNPFSRLLDPDNSIRLRFESIFNAAGASGSAALRCVNAEVVGIIVSRNEKRNSVFAVPIASFVEFLAEVDKGNFLVERQP